ncbi:hypothetical protein OG836_13415 [Micromonospora zamorensis]|uniref:hypothetical protein n=1 Tax=Micromonospora zamorensis TaxID=709883 RepID=UPI002E24D483
MGIHPETNVLPPLYSQLSGVLAGFALAGFSIFLAADDLPPRAGSVSAALFSSFVSFVLLAVLYTTLADDPSSARRAVGLNIYGLPFGLAIVNLVYTLTLVATDRPALTATVNIGRLLVVVFGPVIVMSRLVVAAQKVPIHPGQGQLSLRLGWSLTAAQLLVGVVAIFAAAMLDSMPSLGVLPAFFGLGAATLVGLLSAFVHAQHSEARIRPAHLHAFLASSFAALSGFAVLTALAL